MTLWWLGIARATLSPLLLISHCIPPSLPCRSRGKETQKGQNINKKMEARRRKRDKIELKCYKQNKNVINLIIYRWSGGKERQNRSKYKSKLNYNVYICVCLCVCVCVFVYVSVCACVFVRSGGDESPNRQKIKKYVKTD